MKTPKIEPLPGWLAAQTTPPRKPMPVLNYRPDPQVPLTAESIAATHMSDIVSICKSLDLISDVTAVDSDTTVLKTEFSAYLQDALEERESPEGIVKTIKQATTTLLRDLATWAAYNLAHRKIAIDRMESIFSNLEALNRSVEIHNRNMEMLQIASKTEA